jgi:hypothetical protein
MQKVLVDVECILQEIQYCNYTIQLLRAVLHSEYFHAAHLYLAFIQKYKHQYIIVLKIDLFYL